MSLPTILKTTEATIPAKVPYLQADAQLVAYWKGVLAPLPGLKVGIAWQGSPKYGGDKNRSLPLKHFAPGRADARRHLHQLAKRTRHRATRKFVAAVPGHRS